MRVETADARFVVHHGDNMAILPTLADCSVDAIVTDPPAGIAFMGKTWDSDKGGRDAWIAWLSEVMSECLRVLKPGGHALVWAIPRTSHWTGMAIENAGFEIRDRIAHCFSQGFPKSHSVNRALEKGEVCCGCDTADDLQTLRPSAAEETAVAARSILQQDVRGPSEEKSTDGQDLCDLRIGMDTEGPVSGGAQLDMLADMRGAPHFGTENWQEFRGTDTERSGAVRHLRRAGEDAAEGPGEERKGVLQQIVQRESAFGSSSAVLLEHEGQAKQATVRPGESSLEGRRDHQATEGELQGGSVRSRSGLGSADGTQGRLHHGASARDGATLRVPVDTHGSGRSPGPQPGEQRPEQSTAVPDERGPQTWRGWPLCDRCGKPILTKGLGTSLKPAVEDWWLARKPLVGNVAANVMAHGTGALNVDGCRIGSTVETWPATRSYAPGQIQPGGKGQTQATGSVPLGRWPANLIHSGEPEVLAAFPQAKSSGIYNAKDSGNTPERAVYGGGIGSNTPTTMYGDAGSAARFFMQCPPDEATRLVYTPKASRSDRDKGNTHSTVKPIALMRYLCRLITPPDGVVLDPFAGSGSSGQAAMFEGFRFIGIEQDAGHVDLARHRVGLAARNGWQPGLELESAA